MQFGKTTTLAACALALLATACGDSIEAKELRESSTQAWQDFKGYAISQRDALSTAMDEQMEKMSARLDEMGDDLDAAGEELRGKAQELQKNAAEKLEAVKNASAENWEKAKNELLTAMQKLDEATDELSER